MPVKTVYTAAIEHVSILDENGVFDAELGEGLIPDDDLLKLYEHMWKCRELDMVAFKLQRSGRMGTYPQNWGQEATSAGAAYVMEDQDWLVTSYRENPGLFWRGLPMEYVLWHWMGDERGNQIPDGLRVTPISIPIGSQMLHAAGLAWAGKLRGEKSVAVTFFGDGGSSEGDCHEAMNFATTLDLPVVFFCQNNGWAISTPRDRNVGGETIAQRGLAYGSHCVQVDGNDIFAVVKVVKEAVERAREENKVTFIEGVTYRMGDHTTADDARRYRDPEELKTWEKRDPLLRLRIYMEAKGIWDEAKEKALHERCQEEVMDIVHRAENIEAPPTSDVFNYTYAELPELLKRQRDTNATHALAHDRRHLPPHMQKPADHDGQAVPESTLG